MAYAWNVRLVGRKTPEQVALLDTLTKATLRVEARQHPEDFKKLVRMVIWVAEKEAS